VSATTLASPFQESLVEINPLFLALHIKTVARGLHTSQPSPLPSPNGMRAAQLVPEVQAIQNNLGL